MSAETNKKEGEKVYTLGPPSENVLYDLQTALNTTYDLLYPNFSGSLPPVVIYNKLELDALYKLAVVLVEIRDYVYNEKESPSGSRLLCEADLKNLTEKINQGTLSQSELKKEARKTIIDILRWGYADLNYGNCQFNAIGFPDQMIFYPEAGKKAVYVEVDWTGTAEFSGMWLSGVINILEVYITIRTLGGYENYLSFLNTPISYQKTSGIMTPIKSSILVPCDQGKKIEGYGSVSTDGLESKYRGTPFSFESFGGPYWKMDYGRTDLVGATRIVRISEGNIHKNAVNNFKAALKTVFDFYNKAKVNYSDKIWGFTDTGRDITGYIRTLAPGLCRQNGWIRTVKACKQITSFHHWLLAVDIDAERNPEYWPKPYSRLGQPIYRPFIDIMQHYGFASLGVHENWDWMHFQFAIWNDVAKNQSNSGINDTPSEAS